MRCWNCHTIIAIPDVIGGKAGVAGSIRAGTAGAGSIIAPGTTVRAEFNCGQCGAMYIQSTELAKFRALARGAGAAGSGARGATGAMGVIDG